MSSQWKIGWITPSYIVAGYLAALVIAGVHIGFFHYIDGKSVDNGPIPQSFVTPISTALVFAFGHTLGTSLSTGYTQRIWQRFRQTPHKAETIDQLYTATHTPFTLLTFSLLKKAPVEWMFASVFWVLSVATIFVPGALEIQAQGPAFNETRNVPLIDVNYRPTPGGDIIDPRISRNLTMAKQAFFHSNYESVYQGPYPEVASVGQQMLLSGEIVTGRSPCGDNCSYALDFVGPAFKCEDITTSNPNLNASVYLAEQHKSNVFSRNYIATNNYVDGSWGKTTNGLMNGTKGASTKTLDFLVTWAPGLRDSSNSRTIQCALWVADYHVDMEYQKGEQHTNTTLSMIRPLNATTLTTVRYILYQAGVPTEPEVFMEFQARAIRDALVNPLLGYLYWSEDNRDSENTIIEATPYTGSLLPYYSWKEYPKFELKFDPLILETLLQNMTISMLSLPQFTFSTPVETEIREWGNYYTLEQPHYIYASYGSALLVSLLFIILALVAIHRNGVSAESGFLQVVCTTTGSQALEEAAVVSCLGGDTINSNKDLKNLELVFGELRSGGVRRAGFGVPEEVVGIKKGATYGSYASDDVERHMVTPK